MITSPPWQRDGYNLTSIIKKVDGKWKEICDFKYGDDLELDFSIDEALANSAFAIKAVNSHSEILNALKEFVKYGKYVENEFGAPNDLVSNAEKAIAKADG